MGDAVCCLRIHLRGLQTGRERARERGREKVHPSSGLLSSSDQTRADARSQEHLLGPPHEWQSPKHLGHVLLPSLVPQQGAGRARCPCGMLVLQEVL